MPTKKKPVVNPPLSKRSSKLVMSPQGYFDTVWNHFVVQRKPLAVADGVLRLHGPKGARSPGGLFLPKEVYSKTFDDCLFDVIVERLSKNRRPEAREVAKQLRECTTLLDDLDATQLMVVNTQKIGSTESAEILMSVFLSWVARDHNLVCPKPLSRYRGPTTPGVHSRNSTANRKKGGAILTRAF